MREPSKKSRAVAEEILDHVNYGLSRADIIREWAEVIDENNLALIEAANDLIDSAATNQGVPEARYVRKLQALLAEYQPQPEIESPEAGRNQLRTSRAGRHA